MMPGTGCCALPDSVRLTAHAMKLGCGGVLMLPPFYYKGVSDDGLFRSFAEVIERVGDARLRVYVYHIPPVAQVPITLALVERLLKAYPTQIAGMKDSGGDWSNTKAFLDAFAEVGLRRLRRLGDLPAPEHAPRRRPAASARPPTSIPGPSRGSSTPGGRRTPTPSRRAWT